MPQTATGMRTVTRNAPCAHCRVVQPSLKLCSACGSAAYCGRACQKAAWPTHSPVCKALVNSTDASAADGYTAIMFDRPFGGFLSIAQRRMFLVHGPGVIVATLSAHPAEYRPRAAASPSAPRTISLRYVPKNAIPSLDESLAAASRMDNCKLVEHASVMTESLFSDVPGRYPGQMYAMVIRTAGHVDFRYHAKVSLMLNWLSDTHPAHTSFASDPRLSDEQLVQTVFNWDTKELIMPRSFSVRTVPAEISKMIIGEQFYEQCMQVHRNRKESLKRGQPVQQTGLCPPFAQSLSLNQLKR